jgi:hypothetical protein
MSDHFTDAGTELGRLAAKTPAGMAYFVEAGPAGTTCGGCKFFMGTIRREVIGKGEQQAGRCREYIRMMRAKGYRSAPLYELPSATPSCRHFETKAQARRASRAPSQARAQMTLRLSRSDEPGGGAQRVISDVLSDAVREIRDH